MCLFSIIDSSKQHHFMINVNAAIQTYCPVFRPGATDETVSLELITDSVRFYSALEKAKKAWDALDESVCLTLKKDAKSRNAFLTCYSLEDYSQMKLLLLSNDNGGCALKKNGEIVSVFRHPGYGKVKIAETVMPVAIELGGNRLDCFSGDECALPAIYGAYGFIPVAKVSFDIRFKPDNWNDERDGTPDIVYMMYDKKIKALFDGMETKERKTKIRDKITSLTPVSCDDAEEACKKYAIELEFQ